MKADSYLKRERKRKGATVQFGDGLGHAQMSNSTEWRWPRHAQMSLRGKHMLSLHTLAFMNMEFICTLYKFVVLKL
jgi:hypothetical protein